MVVTNKNLVHTLFDLIWRLSKLIIVRNGKAGSESEENHLEKNCNQKAQLVLK